MRAILFILLLLALLIAPDPHLTARWDSDHATVALWSQSGRACLSRQPAAGPGVFVGCYDRVGGITLTFGAVGPMDAAYRPTAGDVYMLVTNGETYRAPLVGRAQYLPVWR